MTNAEFYKDKIRNCKANRQDFCKDFIEPIVLGPIKCEDIDCSCCNALVALWLTEEHKEPDVDWDNVPVDTPILVRDCESDEWHKGHFAKKDDRFGVGIFFNGRTSFSAGPQNSIGYCKYAKLWEGSEEQAAEKEAQCTD